MQHNQSPFTIVIKMPDFAVGRLEVFSLADKKNLKISEKEVYDEVQSHRAGKKR